MATEVTRKFKKDYYARLAEIVRETAPTDSEELISFIDHEIELLSAKASKKTPTKTQKENVAVTEKICEVLAEAEKPMTVTELMAADTELGQYSNQKLSALLSQLVKSNKVIKTIDKRRSYFALAAE